MKKFITLTLIALALLGNCIAQKISYDSTYKITHDTLKHVIHDTVETFYKKDSTALVDTSKECKVYWFFWRVCKQKNDTIGYLYFPTSYDSTVKNGAWHDSLFRNGTTHDTTGTKYRDVIVSTKRGVLVNQVDIGTKISVEKDLGVEYVREGVDLRNWQGKDYNYTQQVNSGFKVLYNVTPDGQDGHPFSKDTNLIRTKFSSVVKTIQADVFVFGNEEDNWNYHQRSTQDYLNGLKDAIDVAHANGTKITNGGIHPEYLTYLVWKDYKNRGMNKEADEWMALTFAQPMKYAAQHPELTSNKFLQHCAQIDSFLNAYRDLSLDFVNTHWYAPLNQIVTDTTKFAFVTKTIADYVRTRTGKKLLSNECGQTDKNPSTVTAMLSAFIRAGFEYVIWYSADGSSTLNSPAYALNNLDGRLRPNGIAFKKFQSENK